MESSKEIRGALCLGHITLFFNGGIVYVFCDKHSQGPLRPTLSVEQWDLVPRKLSRLSGWVGAWSCSIGPVRSIWPTYNGLGR